MFMESPLHVVGEANINVVSGFTTYGINIESHSTIYYKKSQPCKRLAHGTEGGNRTRTPLRELDFESSASTNSATSACFW